MKHLSLDFQADTSGDLPDNQFHGIASAYDVKIDDFGDTITIEQGAFRKTITENKKRVKVFYRHRDLIGKPLEMRDTPEGLYVKGQISPTRLGLDVIQLIKDKVLTEMSVGIDVIKIEREQVTRDRVIRRYKEVRLWEFSLVPHGRNPKTKIYGTDGKTWKLFEDAVAGYEGEMSLDKMLTLFWDSLTDEQRTSKDVQSAVQSMIIEPTAAPTQDTDALSLGVIKQRMDMLANWDNR